MISQRAWCTAVLRTISIKWALMYFDREWRRGKKETWGIASSKSSLLSKQCCQNVQPIQKHKWFNLQVGYTTSSVLSKLSKKANIHIFLPTADCTGDRTAPRGALMPLVIICNTQLSLESYKQQPEHSREQQGHELISQPSGAGKWCRHHPLVLKPDWSKEPHVQMV